MLRFSASSSKPESQDLPPVSKPVEAHPLDPLTGGAFSAPTSGERSARIREWLATEPSPEQIQEVFKDMSVKDKGAAKALREKLDEIKRQKGQESLAREWAAKGQLLVDAPKLNIADALAWQRDAAKAGAPLSREPLAGLKQALAERVKGIEDLQHRVQVQREAAVLLAQRIEVLSTKSWKDAEAALDSLRVDTLAWQGQAADLLVMPAWASVDAKFPPLLDASKAQLLAVWSAFEAALSQAAAAAADAEAPLPPVPVWAEELAQQRVPETASAEVNKLIPRVTPEKKAEAQALVSEALSRVEQEVAEGHGKASAGAANALRQALKEHGRWIDADLDARVHAALSSAGELEGWQRWRADQIREELVIKAEGLLKRPEGQALGGRKMQETLRQMRDQWKQTDQGGVPNHALWKRFDEACNQAHKVVEAWLEKVRSEAAVHRAHRLALIEEVKAWTAQHHLDAQANPDWKGVNRALHQFADRWRDAGHLSEKAYGELQPLWKAAIHEAHIPLETAQKASIERRKALIDEAIVLGDAPNLRVDAVKALQQRWQAEAQVVPLDRKLEQKLWDSFRKPLDEAFNRKSEERQKTEAALSERDKAVLEASKSLAAANASGDAQAIRVAMAALELILQGGGQGASPTVGNVTEKTEPTVTEKATPTASAKPLVAVRGDDRPGMKKSEPAPAGRDGRSVRTNDRQRPGRGDASFGRGADRQDRPMARAMQDSRGPRLGDAAFRAQRDAMEQAQLALKKLASQAHGEVITQMMQAWAQRDAQMLPGASELGRQVSASLRSSWVQALGQAANPAGKEALLRLEMAADVPTPAQDLDARRALQLQLLTRRNDPAPAQTWGQDVAKLLSAAHDEAAARRLQNVLKTLLRR